MRILIDECINPRVAARLRELTPEWSVTTVRELGWTGSTDQTIANLSHGQIDVFLTIDRGFEFEHNLREFTFGIVIAHPQSNQMPAYEMFWDVLMTALTEVRPTQVIHAYPRKAPTVE